MARSAICCHDLQRRCRDLRIAAQHRSRDPACGGLHRRVPPDVVHHGRGPFRLRSFGPDLADQPDQVPLSQGGQSFHCCDRAVAAGGIPAAQQDLSAGVSAGESVHRHIHDRCGEFRGRSVAHQCAGSGPVRPFCPGDCRAGELWVDSVHGQVQGSRSALQVAGGSAHPAHGSGGVVAVAARACRRCGVQLAGGRSVALADGRPRFSHPSDGLDARTGGNVRVAVALDVFPRS